MGCASSTPDVKHAGNAGQKSKILTAGLTAQMTVGERLDHKLKHNKHITDCVEEAAQWLNNNNGRWIWDCYQDETRMLGRGAYAKVFLGKSKVTKELVAIKSITKDSKLFEQQRRAIVMEVACMRELQGHRSMVELYEVFNEPEGIYMIMEYLPARPLFEAIVEKGHFSEADAAIVMRQLLSFIEFMHDRNIVNRDIKPENVLLLKPKRSTVLAAGGSIEDGPGDSDDDEDTKANKRKCLTPEEETLVDEDMWADVPDGLRLKVIDYGTASFCEAGQHLHSCIGTARYVAPEVLSRNYDKSSDIWSAGVILYILLCGHAPFECPDKVASLEKVKHGQYSMEGPEWDEISASAKDLLSHMLVVDPEQRWTAEELLEHMWFQEAPKLCASVASVHNGYMSRLKGFSGYSRMKRLALRLMANQPDALTLKEVDRLKELFVHLDEDGDGLIDGKTLHRGLAAVGCELPEHDVRELLEVSKIDMHTSAALIGINEFIAALFNIDRVVALKPHMVEEEFARLDVDKDGVISPADLVASSHQGGDIAELLAQGAGPLTLDEAEEILAELQGGATSPDKLALNLEQFRSLVCSTSGSNTLKRAATISKTPRGKSGGSMFDSGRPPTSGPLNGPVSGPLLAHPGPVSGPLNPPPLAGLIHSRNSGAPGSVSARVGAVPGLLHARRGPVSGPLHVGVGPVSGPLLSTNESDSNQGVDTSRSSVLTE